MTTLIWLQRDLRINNNQTLNWAINRGKPVVAIYVHSPDEDAPWAAGAASCWWLHHSLQKLERDLKRLNIKLFYFLADSQSLIPQLVTTLGIDAVGWTERVEPNRRLCEQNIESRLSNIGVEVRRFNDNLLHGGDKFFTRTKDTPYRVFTPFYRRMRSELDILEPLPSRPVAVAGKLAKPTAIKGEKTLDQLGLLADNNWHEKFHRHWQPGEETASNRMATFVEGILGDYKLQRDYPAVDGTSALSAHLHFGEISPRQILDLLLPFIQFNEENMSDAAEGFLRQVIWREFARYILWHFPDSVSKSMNQKFDSTFWRNDPVLLKKWQRGETGIPIVDAGMKQLWQTGIMHNRVRMLVASLLTKNLGLPWQQGAAWFWDTLIDADLANNSMGWQWVAGCGLDASPYFRIFNPYTQTQRFDARLEYQKQWLGQESFSSQLESIVDVKLSRSDALERYKGLDKKQVKQ